jgi:hypothetical protein
LVHCITGRVPRNRWSLEGVMQRLPGVSARTGLYKGRVGPPENLRSCKVALMVSGEPQTVWALRSLCLPTWTSQLPLGSGEDPGRGGLGHLQKGTQPETIGRPFPSLRVRRHWVVPTAATKSSLVSGVCLQGVLPLPPRAAGASHLLSRSGPPQAGEPPSQMAYSLEHLQWLKN